MIAETQRAIEFLQRVKATTKLMIPYWRRIWNQYEGRRH